MSTSKLHPGWDILKDLVSYIPAVFALILITNEWNGEWLVIAALGAGAGGRRFIKNLKLRRTNETSGTDSVDTAAV